MDYCKSGDLKHYIPLNFYNLNWQEKLSRLESVVKGLTAIHNKNIIHRNFHSGNILTDGFSFRIGSLGLSKSAFELSDDDEEIYGVIPYTAPEVLQGKHYTKASDIYSFGMIMWELMTGREPFWDQNHDTDLIIGICDGLRPPIVTNAPEGYVELMQSCWNSHINKRPTIIDIELEINKMKDDESINTTKIKKSSDIGPIDHGVTYDLDAKIKSDESLRSKRIIIEYISINHTDLIRPVI
ncbi:3941_t:CDS:1 [Funneliformis geosporum]|nr:3941_t:CDS:1 [Funneliformis geosporum]